MTATASWLVQKGIVSALRASTEVTSLLAEGADSIVDQVVEGQLYPYIVVGEGVEREEIFFGQGGHVVTPELFVYTKDGSDTPSTTGSAGYKQGLAIADAVVEVLQDDSLFTVDDHDVVMVNQFADWGKQRLQDPANVREITPKLEITLEDTEIIDGGMSDPDQDGDVDGGGA